MPGWSSTGGDVSTSSSGGSVWSSTGGAPVPPPVPGRCALNSEPIRRFEECRSLAVAKAQWSERRDKHHSRSRGVHIVGAIVPVVIAIVVACCIRRRCKKRCAERRAALAAAQAAAAAAAGTAAPVGVPVAIATAVPLPLSAPLVYAHNPVAPMYAPSPAPASSEVEMRMYPGLVERPGTPSHSGTYARLDQEV